MAALIVATRNEHKLRELREALPGIELEPLPEEVELPPEDGDTFEANALGKARAAHEATGGPAIADDSGIEAAGARRPPGRSLGPLCGRGRERRAEPREAARRGARGRTTAASPTSARSRWSTRRATEQRLRGPLRGRARGRAPRRGRLRLRPGLRPATTPGPATSARWPSCGPTRSTRSATAGGRRGMLARAPRGGGSDRQVEAGITKPAAAGVSIASNAILIALKLAAAAITGSIAILSEALHSIDRPDRLGDRLRRGAPRRRARRRRAPLRAREDRERRRLDRGHADPGRRGMHHLRVGRAGWSTGAEVESLGIGIAVIALLGRRQRRGRLRSCAGRRASTTRRRSPATPPTWAPTRSPRSACWSALVLVEVTGAECDRLGRRDRASRS